MSQDRIYFVCFEPVELTMISYGTYKSSCNVGEPDQSLTSLTGLKRAKFISPESVGNYGVVILPKYVILPYRQLKKRKILDFGDGPSLSYCCIPFLHPESIVFFLFAYIYLSCMYFGDLTDDM